MGRLFGTDGVRGVANTELTCELAFSLGKAAAFVLSEEAKQKPRIIIGKDTRKSGDMLENAIAAGICSAGAEAVCVGVISTPAVAYLIREYSADAGVVISASHNPAEFNGIKIFNSCGYKLPDEIEERIEKIILDNTETLPTIPGDGVGSVVDKPDAKGDYVSFLKRTIDTTFEGLKIALDRANGAAYETRRRSFAIWEQVLVINDKPDGLNINKNCGSTHMETLAEYVVNNECHLGLLLTAMPTGFSRLALADC